MVPPEQNHRAEALDTGRGPSLEWSPMLGAIADGERIEVGGHTVHREGPVLHIVTRSRISLPQMEQFAAMYEAMRDEQGYILLLIRMLSGTDMTMDARRKASQWGSLHGQCLRAAVYDSSFFLRTALSLINRAANALTGNAPQLVFFAHEEEARTWLMGQIPALTSMPQTRG